MAVARLQGLSWVQLVPAPVVLTKRLSSGARECPDVATALDTSVRVKAVAKRMLAIRDWLLRFSIVSSLKGSTYR
jgi:hypothetical protein